MHSVKFSKGFSILEIVIAMSIASFMSLAVLKLQYVTEANSTQSLIRQKVMIISDNMINQLKVVLQNDEQLNDMFMNNFYTAYSDKYIKCNYSMCSKEEFSKYIINEWKKQLFDDAELARHNVKAIVCYDSSLQIPNMETPNCDMRESSPLLLKVVWLIHGDEKTNKALVSPDNHIILRLPIK